MTVTLKDRTLRNYRILGTLGRGGMGTVYLASTVRFRKGLPAGTRVAVKVLHPHLAAQDGIVQRFKREAGLGLSIRHPRVMTTYDVGSGNVSGQDFRYIVMELLEGRTLDRVLAEEGPFSEQRLLSVGRQVAEGLAAFHGRGVIHRDIKPSNLFVDSEGNTKIGDLGLSRLLEPTTEISLPGTFLGSAAYAAPEQIDTEDMGPEADLYSLGVTLYELATGKNPFEAADLRSTLLAHEKVKPEPLGRMRPGSSYFLEKVLEQLLQKDVTLRLGPAGKVARILAEQERSDWWQDFVRGEGSCAHLVGSRGQFRVQRAARLHGRDAAFLQLSDLLRTATVGRTGQVGVVVGEAGVGKTRLIDAALEANPDSPATLLVSRFLPQSTPTPYFPLNRVLLAAFELGDLPKNRRRSPLIKSLRSHLPERSVFAERFASLIDNHEVGTDQVQLPHDAIPGLYAEVIRTLSVRQPIVLVIEELQWADQGSIRVLQSLASSLEAFPLALILTSRPGPSATVSSGPSPLEPFLENLRQRHGVLRIDLERLDRDAVQHILKDVGVARETESLLADRLHESSEGNPAFLFALIDDLRRRERLFNVNLEEMRALPLPSSISDFLERRVEDLDPDARRFLEFASVFGTRFKLQPIVEGLQLDLVTASELIGRLTRQYQLVRAFDQAYRFDYHLLREKIYRGIPQKRRREYHRIVAGLVARESTHPHDASRASYEAGVHFSLADVKAEAARYLVGAVRYLMERSLHERAERLAIQASGMVERLVGRPEGLTAAEQFAVHECLA
ncbi:MAG: protein kinase, partial [Planctomycetota bacterium]